MAFSPRERIEEKIYCKPYNLILYLSTNPLILNNKNITDNNFIKSEINVKNFRAIEFYSQWDSISIISTHTSIRGFFLNSDYSKQAFLRDSKI